MWAEGSQLDQQLLFIYLLCHHLTSVSFSLHISFSLAWSLDYLSRGTKLCASGQLDCHHQCNHQHHHNPIQFPPPPHHYSLMWAKLYVGRWLTVRLAWHQLGYFLVLWQRFCLSFLSLSFSLLFLFLFLVLVLREDISQCKISAAFAFSLGCIGSLSPYATFHPLYTFASYFPNWLFLLFVDIEGR